MNIGGRIIREVEPTTTNNLDGIWHLNTIANYIAQGKWPVWSAGGATDPDFANVSLLMHFDSDFADSSANSLTPTNNGVVISSAQSKFGGASAYFNGSSKINFSSSNAVLLGGSDFTLEFWVYKTIDNEIVTWNADVHIDAAVRLQTIGDQWNLLMKKAGSGGWDVNTTFGTAIDNQWYHIAICRESQTVRVFVDGVSEYENSSFSGDLFAGTVHNALGGYSSSFAGYIDDFRLTKSDPGLGGARYTSNFTPPAAAFPDS